MSATYQMDDFYVHEDLRHICSIYNLDPILVSSKQNVAKSEMINYALNLRVAINKKFDKYNKLLTQRHINYLVRLSESMHDCWMKCTYKLCESDDIRCKLMQIDIALLKEISLIFYKIYRLASKQSAGSLYSLCQSSIIEHVMDDINRFPIYIKSMPSSIACEFTQQYVSNMYYLRQSSLRRSLTIMTELENDKTTNICTKLAGIITKLWNDSNFYN